MDTESFAKNKPGKFARNTEGLWSFVPNDLPPVIEPTWELSSQISEADRKLSELAGTARTLPNPHLLIGPFSRREALLSSKIEGTIASLSDLLSYEALGTARNDKYAAVREVSNYVQALNHGLKRLGELPISLRLIRELHDKLMRGVRGESMTPGEFRARQNWIGDPGCKISEATFVPPPIPEMKESLDAFEKYIHQNSPLPPLVKMAVMHYQFEAVHPFLDGNGRIGRLLIVLMLVNEGLLPQPLLYLSAFFERYRSEYYRLLLRVSQHGDWSSWITFFLRGVAEQSMDAISRAQKLQALSAQYRDKFQNSRSSAALLKLTDSLFHTPYVTVRSVVKLLKQTQPSAQAHIDKLRAENILEEVTGKQRGRVYLASGILAVSEEETTKENQLPIKFPAASAS